MGLRMAQGLVERYADRLHGMLSCYDRIVVTGTLPGACYAQGMTAFLYSQGIRIFDYSRFAEPLRDAIRDRAQELTASVGVRIEHIAKPPIRKEDVVAKVLKDRGNHPGLVHIISAMEACQSYQPWHDKGSGKSFLKPDMGKCLHYYFFSSIPSSGCVTCGCRPGARSSCSSTAMAGAGVQDQGVLISRWPTIP